MTDHWAYFKVITEYGWPAELNIICTHPDHPELDIAAYLKFESLQEATSDSLMVPDVLAAIDAHWQTHHAEGAT